LLQCPRAAGVAPRRTWPKPRIAGAWHWSLNGGAGAAGRGTSMIATYVPAGDFTLLAVGAFAGGLPATASLPDGAPARAAADAR
jgi:hypothetical protein